MFKYQSAREYWEGKCGLKKVNKLILEMASNLPLLPVHKFSEGIDEIEKEIINYDQKYHEKLRKFIKYLRRYWVPKKRNYCVGDLAQRTNNLNESANKRLFTRLGGLHPGIWKFISKFVNDSLHILNTFRKIYFHYLQLVVSQFLKPEKFKHNKIFFFLKCNNIP